MHASKAHVKPGRGKRDACATAFGIAVLLMARSSLADHYQVPSGSMRPTVEVGDRIFVNKAAHGLRLPWTKVWLSRGTPPERGEVVVLESPEDGRVLLKRIVAVDGDVVAVRQGQLFLNGKPVALDERSGASVEHLGSHPHAVRLTEGGGADLSAVTVPSGRVLVMGDNRGNSRDSRAIGFIAEGAVLGRAVAVYWRAGAPTWLSL